MDVDTGSFRDRRARIFYDGGRVLRALSPHALEQWEALSRTRFFAEAMAAGKIVRTALADPATWLTGARDDGGRRSAAPGLAERGQAPSLEPKPSATASAPWVAVLEHERIPFVSYPYEWCFGMLRDAALLQLELMRLALAEGMILKDATPYNVQWRDGRPVFIDVPSFERISPGEPWAGYRQFCQLFLYPLLLQSHRGIAFQPWLRGSLEGIEAREATRVLRGRDLLRAGVLLHVWLQARGGAGTTRDVRREMRRAGFHAELIAANVRGLEKLVRGLERKAKATVWSEYSDARPYEESERAAKEAFVRAAVGGRRRRLVWDLGCNTGEFSRIAAENADLVVAMDADQLCVERLYGAAKGNARILPLVMPLADTSPSRGWRGRERLDLVSRGAPDLVLSLALVHHMVIGANIPLDELVDWLADLGGDLVVEFVARDDPAVRQLLANKADIYDDYDAGHFERCLQRRYRIERRAEIGGGRRLLYHAVRV